jgi:hypothetical protein
MNFKVVADLRSESIMCLHYGQTRINHGDGDLGTFLDVPVRVRGKCVDKGDLAVDADQDPVSARPGA